MDCDKISKIWIDNMSRLCVQPSITTFEFIYRSAMEVHWDSKGKFLYSPPILRTWTPVDWFLQIISAAENEYGYQLYITSETIWENIDESLKQSILTENATKVTKNEL